MDASRGPEPEGVEAISQERDDLAKLLDEALDREKVREADLERAQESIDKAYGAMHASQYVGGPTEREAWRTATDALGPLVTQHTADNSEALAEARERGGDEAARRMEIEARRYESDLRKLARERGEG